MPAAKKSSARKNTKAKTASNQSAANRIAADKISAKTGRTATGPITAAEAKALFADLASEPVLVLAVSGGPDSMAMLALAARWRESLSRGPKLIAVTVDHGLRPESAKEANIVKRHARELGIPHRILRWSGRKPKTGLQEAARLARYRLLSEQAAKAKARIVLTAHTRDDQAETLLLRLMRGSGLSGLSGMARANIIFDMCLVRPLLDLPKSRLIATLERFGLSYADDSSNRDPRFTRARLRDLMPRLEQEGLVPARLALLASRVRRAEAALDEMVAAAARAVCVSWDDKRVVFRPEALGLLPDEIMLRLLLRAVSMVGNEGPVELGKLEALYEALCRDAGPFRRTLAGALVARNKAGLVVERAPARRSARR